MSKSKSFKVNSPKVLSAAIDSEVVIVNLDSGDYYSLLKTGVEVWSAIEKGMSYDGILMNLAQNYTGSPQEITATVNEFISKLEQENLISVEEIQANQEVNISALENENDANKTKPKFEPPAFEKFTDMEDLLLLDPIHEVDESAGWPNVK
ncbi:MAG: PqqD family protein [Rivularia sp. (in: cyanobacteria)]